MSLPLYLVKELPGAAVGFVAGAFCPAIGRAIKSLFVKKTQAAQSAVQAKVIDVAKKL